MAQSITFKYRSGATIYSRTFTALAVRGLDEPDQVEILGFVFEAANFDILEYIKGFRRIITATVGVIQESADRQFMLQFLRSNDRWVYLESLASVYCVLADPEGFENEWKDDVKLFRSFEVVLKENVTYTEWPALLEPVETETLYIKSKVEITGTQASPQTFTTNAGALATDDTGNAYPAINLAAYAVTVILTEHQDCLINRISDVAQSGTDITFTVAHSDMGNPYADGKFYATIAIGLQAK